MTASYDQPGLPASSTITAQELGVGYFRYTVLTCTATPITITDQSSTVQYGGVKVYDFPQGVICSLGATVNGAITLGVTGTITATWGGYFSLGTATAGNDADLTSTEDDILGKTAVTTAVAKVGAVTGYSVATQLTESAAVWLDGHTTASDVYLNLAVTDEATHTSGTGTFTGTIKLAWIYLGDY